MERRAHIFTLRAPRRRWRSGAVGWEQREANSTTSQKTTTTTSKSWDHPRVPSWTGVKNNISYLFLLKVRRRWQQSVNWIRWICIWRINRTPSERFAYTLSAPAGWIVRGRVLVYSFCVCSTVCFMVGFCALSSRSVQSTSGWAVNIYWTRILVFTCSIKQSWFILNDRYHDISDEENVASDIDTRFIGPSVCTRTWKCLFNSKQKNLNNFHFADIYSNYLS